jgi:pimeloyl-ACP methyl ester carboxylesterase
MPGLHLLTGVTVEPVSGLEELRIDTGEAVISVSRGGAGPAVLLLHGFAQTKLMWRDIAPRLAQRFTVVCADLHGYGQSSTPPSGTDHAPYSKRAMARDMISVMAQLGFQHFFISGHDRDGRVAYRAALDHPDRVDALAVLDVLPVDTVWDRADDRLALGFWPWSLLAQPEPRASTAITTPQTVPRAAASPARCSPYGVRPDHCRAGTRTMAARSRCGVIWPPTLLAKRSTAATSSPKNDPPPSPPRSATSFPAEARTRSPNAGEVGESGTPESPAASHSLSVCAVQITILDALH